MDSYLKSSTDVVAAYAELRSRTITIIRHIGAHDGEMRVPHCPAWTVRNLIAHLVGVPEDIMAGRLQGVTTETWTQAQVDRHVSKSLSDLAAQWEDDAAKFDAVLAGIPAPVNSQVVFDATTHEHDLRNALGNPGDRDSAAVGVSIGWILDTAEKREAGSAVKLRALGLDDFALMRVFTGRRSRHQIEQLGVDAVSVERWLESTPLSLPTVDIDE